MNDSLIMAGPTVSIFQLQRHHSNAYFFVDLWRTTLPVDIGTNSDIMTLIEAASAMIVVKVQSMTSPFDKLELDACRRGQKPGCFDPD